MKENKSMIKFYQSSEYPLSTFQTYSSFLSVSKKKSKRKIEDPYKKKYVLTDIPILPENYKTKSDIIMNDYKYEGQEEEFAKLLKNSSKILYKKEQEEVMKYMNRTKLFNSSNSSTCNYLTEATKHNLLDESTLKVHILTEGFKNPLQSLDLIKKNRIIYESMLKNFGSREKLVFMQTASKMNRRLYDKSISSKVKITTMIPKLQEQTAPLQNGTEIQLVNNELHKHLSSMKLLSMNNLSADKKEVLFHCSYQYSSKNFPESREQFSWSYEGEGGDMVLFGGLLSNKSNVMWKLDHINLEWLKETPENLSANLRYGHTGVLHHKRFFLFGGKFAHCPIMADLEVYNLETHLWSTPTVYTLNVLKLRRNHIACNVGQHMFIHGGISENEEYLNDCFLLTFSPIKWNTCAISPDSDPPHLAWHSCCVVLPAEIRLSNKLNVYKIPELAIGRRIISRVRERGIYVFGGRSSEDGPILNDLWIVRLGKKPLDWIKVSTNGQGPSPRYATTLNYYEDGNFVIVHGGRNDYSSDTFALDDTYILELSRLDWMRVVTTFDTRHLSALSRCAHSAIVYTNKLLVFGGMNSENYLGSALFIIDLGNKYN